MMMMAATEEEEEERKKKNAMENLSKAWYKLRLSVGCPWRVPTWDAILITASSPQQAELYEWHLERAKVHHRIERSTIALAVPDPHGCRIGSGGATLSALRALALHLSKVKVPSAYDGNMSVNSEILGVMLDMRILLVHAGGDSRRIPWANPMGKVFLPLPFLADDDPDGPVPSLFDHILAISSTSIPHLRSTGGLFIMTGDVLPCYDFSALCLPENGACVVTVPATVDMAANHGVVVNSSVKERINYGGQTSCPGQTQYKFELVTDLLQKPSAKQLRDAGALTLESTAFLDTGIFAVKGKAWRDLATLALEELDPVLELLVNAEEVSLYEELASSWVPARHKWLESRPLGKKLLTALSAERLYSYCARDLLFLHFGTSLELLNHLAQDHGGRIGRRHLNHVADEFSCDLAPSAVILSSEINGSVSIGQYSLLYDSTLCNHVSIGSQCVIVGVHLNQLKNPGCVSDLGLGKAPITIPDMHCLWEVPLSGTACRVTLCCGIEDNPKTLLGEGGTFCGKPWETFISMNRIQNEELWPSRKGKRQDLWNADLFPILPSGTGILCAMWLMGMHIDHCSYYLRLWSTSERVSMSELHRRIDFKKICYDHSIHRSKLAFRIMKDWLACGLVDHNFSRLSAEIIQADNIGGENCMELAALYHSLKVNSGNSQIKKIPLSRIYQIQLDLFEACMNNMEDMVSEDDVWQAVITETAAAVGHGTAESFSTSLTIRELQFPVLETRVELPVRIDIVGGWSDTPPWSLEQIGTVLNMAICIEGTKPVGAEIIVTSGPGILIDDDTGNHLYIDDPKSITTPFQVEDPFRLVKSALVVSGITQMSPGRKGGLEIRTWAAVPRGSGLGTSSILAAAVVKGLFQVTSRDASNENVAKYVLLLEQLMGTGGGWQDQIGGLYPGIKCTSSFPGWPLRLNVDTVLISSEVRKQLEERLLVAFTGQVRLAHKVLQSVVRRYLQRDALLISTIKRLVELAHSGQESLLSGNLEELGRIMLEAWMLHQELCPSSSNIFVDGLFMQVAELTDGYKLVGAGGGGFALLMAKHGEAAITIQEILGNLRVKVYKWSLSD